jgi:predicted acyl esterase
MRSLCKITVVALVTLCCAPAHARTAGYKDWAELEADLVDKKMLHRPIPMRDGVKLDANIYLPRGKGPFPVVLYRSPYPTDIFFKPGALPMNEFNATLLENGYAIVHQNERGRYWSGGEYEYLANAG